MLKLALNCVRHYSLQTRNSVVTKTPSIWDSSGHSNKNSGHSNLMVAVNDIPTLSSQTQQHKAFVKTLRFRQ